MNRLSFILLLVAWSCWFGDGVALLVFVTRLFQYDRDIAIAAAPAINHLRGAGQSASSEFRRLHGFSSIGNLLELLIPLSAGVCLPALLSHRSDSFAKGTQ